MRVALITSEFAPTYGWARYGLEMAAALHAHGVEVVALAQVGAPVPPKTAFDAYHPILPSLVPRVRGFLARSLLTAPRLWRAVRGCDVVHVIAEPYAPMAALIAGRRPLVVTAHGTYVPQTAQQPKVGALYRWAYRRAHLVAVSAYTQGRVLSALPKLDEARIAVVHNGVHFDYFQQPAPAPEKHGPTVLTVGGVKPRKGTHVLVEAFARVRERVPDAQLVVVGSHGGSYAQQLQERIAALGLTDAVHFTGVISEEALRGWYQHADVFALPSLNVGAQFEGFGLVFLEAGACGLPVVGTSGSGVAEAVRDGETGLLVPQNDADALADALVRLLTDEALRARMGKAGRDFARSQDWAHVAERIAALYRQWK